MERTARVSFDFIEMTPTKKGMFGDNVIAEMSANAIDFPTPDVPLLTLTAKNDELKLKTQQALSGDKVKIAERNETEDEWESLFRKEAEYVQRIANGNKVLIAKSGFHTTDTEVGPVAVPAQASIDGWANKGRGSGIHVEMEPLSGCKGFVFVISPRNLTGELVIKGDKVKMKEGAGEVDVVFTTKRKVDFTDLNSGQLYFITAFGFNATGVGELANTIEVIAP
jgi:hypothetical protein